MNLEAAFEFLRKHPRWKAHYAIRDTIQRLPDPSPATSGNGDGKPVVPNAASTFLANVESVRSSSRNEDSNLVDLSRARQNRNVGLRFDRRRERGFNFFARLLK